MIKKIAALFVLGAAVVVGSGTRPHIFSSLFGDQGCEYRDTMYSHTSAVCQRGSQYRCDDGRWEGLGIACTNDPLVAAKSCGLEGRWYLPGSASCQSGSQYRCDDGAWKNLVVACKTGDIEARMARDARSCRYSGATFATQSTICKAGTTFRCEDSDWRSLGTACQ